MVLLTEVSWHCILRHQTHAFKTYDLMFCHFALFQQGQSSSYLNHMESLNFSIKICTQLVKVWVKRRNEKCLLYVYSKWALLLFLLPFILHIIIPCTGSCVCYVVNKETLLELRTDLRWDTVPATIIDFSWIGTRDLLYTSRIVSPLSHVWCLVCSLDKGAKLKTPTTN